MWKVHKTAASVSHNRSWQRMINNRKLNWILKKTVFIQGPSNQHKHFRVPEILITCLWRMNIHGILTALISISIDYPQNMSALSIKYNKLSDNMSQCTGVSQHSSITGRPSFCQSALVSIHFHDNSHLCIIWLSNYKQIIMLGFQSYVVAKQCMFWLQ